VGRGAEELSSRLKHVLMDKIVGLREGGSRWLLDCERHHEGSGDPGRRAGVPWTRVPSRMSECRTFIWQRRLKVEITDGLSSHGNTGLSAQDLGSFHDDARNSVAISTLLRATDYLIHKDWLESGRKLFPHLFPRDHLRFSESMSAMRRRSLLPAFSAPSSTGPSRLASRNRPGRPLLFGERKRLLEAGQELAAS